MFLTDEIFPSLAVMQWAFGKSVPAWQLLGGSHHCCRWNKCLESNSENSPCMCQEGQGLDCKTQPTILPGLVTHLPVLQWWKLAKTPAFKGFTWLFANCWTRQQPSQPLFCLRFWPYLTTWNWFCIGCITTFLSVSNVSVGFCERGGGGKRSFCSKCKILVFIQDIWHIHKLRWEVTVLV